MAWRGGAASREESTSSNPVVATAVAEKISVLQTASYSTDPGRAV
jgi:hypothetical protein